MSADVRTAAGSLPRTGSPPTVLIDGNALGPGYTPGASRGVALQIKPSVMQRFTIVGYSVQIRMFAYLSNQIAPSGGYWARFGSLWAGLYINTPAPDSPVAAAQNGAQFPPDLSTFSEIWTGSDDPIRSAFPVGLDPSPTYKTSPRDYSLLARNVMLPQPVEILPSSNLGFGVVLTPSLTIVSVALWIDSVDFSVLYTVETLPPTGVYAR